MRISILQHQLELKHYQPSHVSYSNLDALVQIIHLSLSLLLQNYCPLCILIKRKLHARIYSATTNRRKKAEDPVKRVTFVKAPPKLYNIT